MTVCRVCGKRVDVRNMGRHEDECLRAPVCICDEPDPDAWGECRDCLRPFKPGHAGLMGQRERWRALVAALG